jgi:hypothetical protein
VSSPAGAPPPFAVWRHHDAREGFEVVFLEARRDGGLHVEGHTAALEDGEPFAVRYEIELDGRWRTRSARVAGRSLRGRRSIALEADGEGSWSVDGQPAPHLDGCLDLDLESSALTNAFPVHRLGLAPGASADAPAAYVRALDLAVDRLEQSYRRIDDGGAGGQRYDYAAPVFDFTGELAYDESGLVVEYPGLATRVRG